jgi:hypothetical protein
LRKAFTAAFVALGILAIAAATAAAPKAAAKASLTPTQVHLIKAGTGKLTGSPPASTVPAGLPNEIDAATVGNDADASNGGGGGDEAGVNRTLPGAKKGNGHAITSTGETKSDPGLGASWEGLNFHDQRFANGGKQYSVEPPDQGLCAGNGFVVEAVNDVVQVYDSGGHALLNGGNAVDLNTFYGYPAAIDRSTGAAGPDITDPSCLYDAAVNRFFMVVLTLDRVGTTTALAGTNHLDIAVSDTGDPTGTWSIYHLPLQNNGTDGTPDHGCDRGFCLGDYPHIGADANGIYLTTNEFSTLGSGFYGSQIYAISKAALAAGTASTVVLFDTLGAGPDGAGFTVWPAQSPGTNNYASANHGTEYFLSSRAVFADDGTSDSILQWTMSNTASLDTPSPSPTLALTEIGVDEYAVPPLATQPAGNHPLGDCLADTTFPCNTTIAGTTSHDNRTYGGDHQLNANDSRMQQVMFANNKLWGALDTDVNVGGQDRAGIAYYVVNPDSAKIAVQGQLGTAGTDYTYPAIGVTQSGRGVMAFTLTGDNDFPSAAYAGIDANVGAGDVHVAAAGAGAWDGFTQYRAFKAGRPRWGDYGAAAVMGNSVWVASEYVAQTCDYTAYKADPTCGGTRAALGNWSTRVSQVTP